MDCDEPDQVETSESSSKGVNNYYELIISVIIVTWCQNRHFFINSK